MYEWKSRAAALLQLRICHFVRERNDFFEECWKGPVAFVHGRTENAIFYLRVKHDYGCYIENNTYYLVRSPKA